MSSSVSSSSVESRICYLSVDGMTDPLGRSQVLPYLSGLAGRGHAITLLSLEKPEKLALSGEAVRALCSAAGIDWRPLPYRRKPPIVAGMWNVRQLSRHALALHRDRPFDIVHARSDMAATAAKPLWSAKGVKLLYDMRALWPDERVEGGSWPQSNPLYRAIFRYFKARQREFLDHASAIVTLTRRGKTLLDNWPGRTGKAPVSVIQCCADFKHFRPASPEERAATRQTLGIAPDRPVIAYLGSIGTWYMLPEMLDFFGRYRERHPDAWLLMITPDSKDGIVAQAKARGLADAVTVVAAGRDEVPALLASADVGLFFIMPVFSKQVSSPTKLGEMLACGLKVVCNAGVGDVGEIVDSTRGGVAITAFSPAAYESAVRAIDALDSDPYAIRESARPWFDLADGVHAYDRIYRQLLSRQ